MAIIANDTQFIGIAPSIDLNGKKSAMLNAQTEPVTMLDIVDTVSAGLPPATNPTNQYVPLNYSGEFADSTINVKVASPGYYGWSAMSTKVGQLISLPPGVDQFNVASSLPSYGLSITNNPAIGTQTSIGDYNTAGQLYFSVIGNYPASPSVSNSLYTNPTVFGINSPFWVKGDGSLVQVGQQNNYSTTNMSNGFLADVGQGLLLMGCGISSPDSGVFKAFGATGRITMGTSITRSIGVNIFTGTIFMGQSLATGTPVLTTTPAVWKIVEDDSGTQYFLPLYQ